MGEAAAQLDKAFHEAHPGIPWPQIVAMRNLLVHRYFGVDLEEVWKTVEKDLPGLKRKIETLVSKLGSRGVGSE
ncbi:HepT-like ribonuclease domain-containing protein [Candidatus Caldatribacterium sp. SIUC1]|uniref:HepT-like ribonuclease domain-containing protein n=1 Tax=Candidatus Caldatribacterium sp. SIUC1 TaxID=3418365 RepID=UPI003F692B84